MSRWSRKLFFPLVLVVFIAALSRIDRVFFKRNHSFCARFIFSSIDNRPEWDVSPPTAEEETFLDKVFNQKFHYLAKGCHCFAFISEDQQYVIKFHRYASHLRKFPWLTHPISYQFSPRRKAILKYNLQRLNENMQSYQDSAQILKDETGLILLHINHTDYLKRHVTLVDSTQAEYQIPLDQVTFILQHKANLIYPTLDKLVSERKIDEAKKVVADVVLLVADCCKKGYIDDDPVLRKNYGITNKRAIHIDVGEMFKKDGIQLRENYIPHVKEMTESLRVRLEKFYPELLPHYTTVIESL